MVKLTYEGSNAIHDSDCGIFVVKSTKERLERQLMEIENRIKRLTSPYNGLLSILISG